MENLFVMTQKELSIYNLMIKVQESRISQVKAAELLGISDRHFRRVYKLYKEQGCLGIVSKRRGLPSNNRYPQQLYDNVIKIIKEHYNDFGPTLIKEKLEENHKIMISVETIRQWMIKDGLWKLKKRKKLKIHQSRLRRSHKGELIQVDGSTHDWFEGRGPKCCLLGFIDDATSQIMYLKFVKSESTQSYFEAIKGYLNKNGKPKSFYTDRLNVFRVNNDKTGYKKSGLTQVGRALKELNITLICANSPQAKGRIERLFSTLQDRLVKEFRLNNISSIEEANTYIIKYIEKHNARFSIEPKEKEDLHEKLSQEEISKALRYKEQRILSKNLEISYLGKILQIQVDRPTYAMRKATVEVIETLDRKIEIEYQGKKLKFKELLVKDHQGTIINKKEALVCNFTS